MLHMLVVDDEEAISFAMARYFRSRGFAVDVARRLDEAQALSANYKYDVVLADLQLTAADGQEGLTLVSWLRDRCPWSRSILLTANECCKTDAAARERGADLVMRKPQPLSELADTILKLAALPR